MTERVTTHGASAVFLGVPFGQSYPHLEQIMEASTVLGGVPPTGFIDSSGMPTATGLEYDERLHTQQQIIATQQQVIATQYQEIRRLRQLVDGVSQQLESLEKSEIEEEPEILNLQPISRRRVNAEVRRYYEPARFQITEEAEDTDSEDTGE